MNEYYSTEGLNYSTLSLLDSNNITQETIEKEGIVYCPDCSVKFAEVIDLYLHVGEEHLSLPELEKIMFFFDYSIKKRMIPKASQSSMIKTNEIIENKQSVMLKLLMEADNPNNFSDFCAHVQNKTILKYKSLFQKFFMLFLKFLIFKNF